MLAQIDIEDLVQRCRSANARTYIKEAVDCYRIGAYRACIITTWIALIYDLVDKLRELALTGDAAAQKRVTEFDKIQKERDTEAALKFEREALTMAKEEFELITAHEMADLNRLFEDRNRCGHPNLNRDEEVYSPPPELSRLHLRTAIEHVLSRPPVQGKAALTSLQLVVDSDYFPTSTVDAEPQLRATALSHAKQNVIREFVFGALTSIMREKLSERKRYQRLAAAQVVQHMHPRIVIDVLEDRLDKKVFSAPDDCLDSTLWLLGLYPDLHGFLKDASWNKLKAYIQNMPSTQLDAIFCGLKIPRLYEATIERLSRCSSAELIPIINRLTFKPEDAIIDRCVVIYNEAGSFDSANFFAKQLVKPLLHCMSALQMKNVLLAVKNFKVRHSFEFSAVANVIKASGRITQEELDSFIHSNHLTGVPPAK